MLAEGILYYVAGAGSIIFTGVFIIPIFYCLKSISVYEYFEHRFDSRLLRRMTCVLFLLATSFYMAVALYSPAVAIATVTRTWWPVWVIVIGCVCVAYTAVGGLKAVVWTDTLQAAFMYAGIGTMIVVGTRDAGGLARLWQIATDTGRLRPLWAHIDATPLQYNSVWISIVGGFCYMLCGYGTNQMALQRYGAMATLNQARIVVAITVPSLSNLFCIDFQPTSSWCPCAASSAWSCSPTSTTSAIRSRRRDAQRSGRFDPISL